MTNLLAGQDISLSVQFEITHACNKNCALCDHRIASSTYAGMTRAQYRKTVSYMDTKKCKCAALIGGEPLVHPDVLWFARRLLADFRHARLWVHTNGLLVPRFRQGHPEVFERLRWDIQEYPGFNDEALAEVGDLPNVRVKPFRPFWNPYRDPNLDEVLARKVRGACLYHVRIVGDRLYNCCLAESIERNHHTDPVHVVMSQNWRKDWARLETWRACQHCFRALDWFDERGHIKR